jgi:predicted RNA polymerase sigma factor
VDDDNINYGDIVLLEEQDRSVMELNRAVAVATANGIG